MVTTRIDLAHVNPQSSELLKELFTQYSQHDQSFFARDVTYTIQHFNPVTLQTRAMLLKLSHNILQRTRNKNPDEKRYEVIDHNNLIGEGGFSQVYGVLSTLTIQGQQVCRKTNKKRVVKIQECSEDELADIQNEAVITQKAKTMHMKQPTVVQTSDDRYRCYLVMQRLDGTDLYKIITQLYKNALDLTTHQRLTIAMKMLQQLKILHAKGIIHRDIKPDNVMLDLNTGELLIFDFGLSKLECDDNDDAGVILGTPGYISPEVFAGDGTNMKSDIFSMSIIIGMLFYANEPAQDAKQFNAYHFENIFNDPKIDLNEKEKAELLHILKKMNNTENTARFNTDEALTAIVNLRENYVNRQIDEMAANRPQRYVLTHGLFVNNMPDKKEIKETRVQSCRF